MQECFPAKVAAFVLRIRLYCENWTRLYYECQLEDSLLGRVETFLPTESNFRDASEQVSPQKCSPDAFVLRKVDACVLRMSTGG